MLASWNGYNRQVTSSPLVLGPLLRYVDATSASIWVETRDDSRVVVRAGDRSWQTRTFAAHGHHYALVEVDGLEPGSVTPYSVEIDGTTVGELRSNFFPYTLPFNITGHPAMTMPCGFGTDGLPIGLQIVGRRFDDVTVLRASAAFEAARPWADRRPPID